MEQEETQGWAEGKSPEYIKAVETFVDLFYKDADLTEDVKPDQTNRDDDIKSREFNRRLMEKLIIQNYGNEAIDFETDALTKLNEIIKVERADDNDKYGHLNEYGEDTNQKDSE